MPLLEHIESPNDVKKLAVRQLPQLAQEVRDFLVHSVSLTGGHLASNLGVVELTIALVYVYDFPQDKVIWDVGHQSYVYKILTGRRARFASLRQFGGLTGFPNREESRYDCFDTGHSSTSISAAIGMARARELRRGTQNIMAVLGDGALTGGLIWEALNDVGTNRTPLTIILNDNEMSIDRNVGGISNYLTKIRLGKRYAGFKNRVRKIASYFPRIYRFMRGVRNGMKFRLIQNKIFEQIGLKYIGPIDGHDVSMLVDYFTLLKDYHAPVVLHVITKKGKGYAKAETDPSVYHGIDPDFGTPDTAWSFSSCLGQTLCELAKQSRDVVAVSAAMTSGTGLTVFAKQFPERFFDVGIAEQHAVTMSAGMAVAGLKPYVAIYSTFLQRAYDQILHDVCLQDLPVTFCLDRAGVSNGDGKTHHGLYDLGYLRTMPHMTIAVPKSPDDLKRILEQSLTYMHPLAIRYPKSCSLDRELPCMRLLPVPGKWSRIRASNPRYNVVAIGDRMLKMALEAKGEFGILYADYLTADGTALHELMGSEKLVVMEDAISNTGLFSLISDYYATHNIGKTPIIVPMGFQDGCISCGKNEELFHNALLTSEHLNQIFCEEIDETPL